MLVFLRGSCYLAVFFIAACLATVAPAAAWQATIERDDFGPNHVGIAVTETGGKAFGLRCENGRVPALTFATRELWDDQLAAIPATLLIKIDDGVRNPAQSGHSF